MFMKFLGVVDKVRNSHLHFETDLGLDQRSIFPLFQHGERERNLILLKLKCIP